MRQEDTERGRGKLKRALCKELCWTAKKQKWHYCVPSDLLLKAHGGSTISICRETEWMTEVDREEKKDILSEVPTNTRTAAHFPHYLHILFCVCGQNLNRNACVFLFFGMCLSTSVCILCVYVRVSFFAGFYDVCVWVCARAWQSATDVRAFIRFRGLFISFWSEAARPARKVWKAAESRLSYFSNSSLSSGG